MMLRRFPAGKLVSPTPLVLVVSPQFSVFRKTKANNHSELTAEN
jgi:hypothetical protein